jgi:hypothetical protein
MNLFENDSDNNEDRIVDSFDKDPFFKLYLNTNREDLYVLQEHISEFLDVKSFKRKYPGNYSLTL